MLDSLIQIDQNLFSLLNGWNASWLDPIMWYISYGPVWTPLYALLLYFILKKYTHSFQQFNWRVVLLILCSFGLVILIADQVASGILKPLIGRLRPSHQPLLADSIHLITKPNGKIYTGGTYGFVSSHAANAFAVAYLSSQFLKGLHLRWMLMLWAILVSYSRIYLGVHFPGDIIGGAIVGLFAGYVTFRIFKYAYQKT